MSDFNYECILLYNGTLKVIIKLEKGQIFPTGTTEGWIRFACSVAKLQKIEKVKVYYESRRFGYLKEELIYNGKADDDGK